MYRRTCARLDDDATQVSTPDQLFADATTTSTTAIDWIHHHRHIQSKICITRTHMFSRSQMTDAYYSTNHDNIAKIFVKRSSTNGRKSRSTNGQDKSLLFTLSLYVRLLFERFTHLNSSNDLINAMMIAVVLLDEKKNVKYVCRVYIRQISNAKGHCSVREKE